MTPWEITVARKLRADVPAQKALADDQSDPTLETQIDTVAADIARTCNMNRRDAVVIATRAVESAIAVQRNQTAQHGIHGALSMDDASDRLLQALSRLWDARNKALAIGCMFFAFDHPPLGAQSFRALANVANVSPEAVSNEVLEFQAILGLDRTKTQKSESALKSYATSNGALPRKL